MAINKFSSLNNTKPFQLTMRKIMYLGITRHVFLQEIFGFKVTLLVCEFVGICSFRQLI